MPSENSERRNIHTISMTVANKPGVLVRIAHVFARRGYNIDSLVVSPAYNPRYSRMTITAQGDPETLDQIIKQAQKLIDVIHANEHTGQDSTHTELAMIKIKVSSANRLIVLKLMKKYRTRVIDDSDNTLIVEQTGTTAELDEFEALMKKYGILEMVRTGKIVMALGHSET
ncbi:MAG TPA: acetolactate synthase small subunit [Candidatus Omnitrophota bacterium]|nr:acetolactate synthase small subunit [Candidatus Omnitrophota bacterium]